MTATSTSTGRRGLSLADLGRKGGGVIRNVALIGMCLVFAMPFLWMVFGSLKSGSELYAVPPTLLPNDWKPDNYAELFRRLPFGMFMLNSVKIAVVVVGGQVLTCSLAGFAFARLRFPGRDGLFAVLLAAMLVPAQVIMVPSFFLFKELGWLDSHLPIMVPAFFGGAFGTFLMRQYFLTMPRELDEAAHMDGASALRVYWSIYLPLAKPALAALAIFIFVANWNDLLWPLIYLSSNDQMTLTVGLSYLQGRYATDWPVVLAGATLSLVPVLLVFALGQRHFMSGAIISGLKR